jgi:hypothetical protein
VNGSLGAIVTRHVVVGVKDALVVFSLILPMVELHVLLPRIPNHATLKHVFIQWIVLLVNGKLGDLVIRLAEVDVNAALVQFVHLLLMVVMNVLQLKKPNHATPKHVFIQ